jgi:aminopeptidase N
MNWDQESNQGKQPSKHKSFFLPGAKPHYNPDRPGQVKHIALNLRLDIPAQVLQGICSIQLQPVASGITQLTLNAVELQVQSVEVDGIAQTFDADGEFLNIRLAIPTEAGQIIKIAIAYRVERPIGSPQRGIYFVLPTAEYPDKPIQVWTQGEDEDSRYWFPCFDYPGQLATSEIKVEVPKAMTAISNGELRQVTETEQTKIFHWYQPQIHPSYLITLAVGEFLEIKDYWQNIPITYYVDKARTEAEASLTMGKTPRMIEFFSQKYGYPYPFTKYAQVCVTDFTFGGMENTSTTLLTDLCVLDQRAAIDNRNSESLVAHELAHQWFGDLVVIKHWSHAWIKEGAASYAEILWTEVEYGLDEAAYYRLGEARSYLGEDAERYRRPMVTNIYREAIELYDRHIYEKGACVYHMIRTELGEEGFDRTIKLFMHQFAHQSVETIDLLRTIELATGKNCLSLFDQYVFRGGHPEYKLNYSWDEESRLAKISVVQEQEELFDLKLAIAFSFVNHSIQESSIPESSLSDQSISETVFKVRVFEKEQSFYFPLAQKPSFISFDRGNHYLKQVTLEYGLAELKSSLFHNPDPLAKIQAVEAIAKKGGLEAVRALETAFQQERFWAIRLELIKGLATIQLDQAYAALIPGLQDDDARVRRATIDAIAKTKTQQSLDLIKPFLKKGDPSYYVEASAAAHIGELAHALSSDRAPDGVMQLLLNTLEQKAGWNEIIRSGAISGLAKLNDSDQALNSVISFTQSGVSYALRLAAIRALGSMGKAQNKPKIAQILNRLAILAKEPLFRTQMSVVNGLAQVESNGAISILQTIADQSADGRIKRMATEAIQKVQKAIGKDAGLKQLREEFDQLKKENQTLKSRLDAIEVKTKTD